MSMKCCASLLDVHFRYLFSLSFPSVTHAHLSPCQGRVPRKCSFGRVWGHMDLLESPVNFRTIPLTIDTVWPLKYHPDHKPGLEPGQDVSGDVESQLLRLVRFGRWGHFQRPRSPGETSRPLAPTSQRLASYLYTEAVDVFSMFSNQINPYKWTHSLLCVLQYQPDITSLITPPLPH